MKKEEKKILYTEPSSYFTKETLEKVFGIVDEDAKTDKDSPNKKSKSLNQSSKKKEERRC